MIARDDTRKPNTDGHEDELQGCETDSNWCLDPAMRRTGRPARGCPSIDGRSVVEASRPGRYDRLDRHPADGLGTGAHTSTVSLYSQDSLRLSTGRILRTRLNLSYACSDKVALEGVSVYGTGAGFVGRSSPGDSFTANSSW